jgi:hypothetical protein
MGKWNDFAKDLRRRLPTERAIRMTIPEIIRATGTTDKDIRQPGWWDLVARGTEAYTALADEEVTLDYIVNDGDVQSVRFFLTWLPPPND